MSCNLLLLVVRGEVFILIMVLQSCNCDRNAHFEAILMCVYEFYRFVLFGRCRRVIQWRHLPRLICRVPFSLFAHVLSTLRLFFYITTSLHFLILSSSYFMIAILWISSISHVMVAHRAGKLCQNIRSDDKFLFLVENVIYLVARYLSVQFHLKSCNFTVYNCNIILKNCFPSYSSIFKVSLLLLSVLQVRANLFFMTVALMCLAA